MKLKLAIRRGKHPLIVMQTKKLHKGLCICTVVNTNKQILVSPKYLHEPCAQTYSFEKISYHFSRANLTEELTKEDVSIIGVFLKKYKNVLSPFEFVSLLNGELRKKIQNYMLSTKQVSFKNNQYIWTS